MHRAACLFTSQLSLVDPYSCTYPQRDNQAELIWVDGLPELAAVSHSKSTNNWTQRKDGKHEKNSPEFLQESPPPQKKKLSLSGCGLHIVRFWLKFTKNFLSNPVKLMTRTHAPLILQPELPGLIDLHSAIDVMWPIVKLLWIWVSTRLHPQSTQLRRPTSSHLSLKPLRRSL